MPSLSSEKVIKALFALKTVPVKAKSIGSVMLSSGMAFALPTDVKTAPVAGTHATNAKRMYKIAFMDLLGLYHRRSECLALPHTTNSCSV